MQNDSKAKTKNDTSNLFFNYFHSRSREYNIKSLVFFLIFDFKLILLDLSDLFVEEDLDGSSYDLESNIDTKLLNSISQFSTTQNKEQGFLNFIN